MNITDLAANLLSPPILLFLLGLSATLLRSDLEIPAPAAKTLSLFLLFAIGMKGGVSLAQSGLRHDVVTTMLAAMSAAVLVPVWSFFALRRRFGSADAAGLAATYGSVSAVTFITACGFITQRGVNFSGHMVAAMALMESPAIIIGVILARRFATVSNANSNGGSATINWGHLGRDALLNGSVFLLLGSLLIGFVCGPVRAAPLKPFIDTLFPGLLALFLLDMGIVAARRLGDLRAVGASAIVFAFLAPLLNASLGLGLAALLGLPHGDALLLVILCASASYIAVPAALRIALPEANPAIYVTLSLALTFPFNIVVGIPLYDFAVTALLGR
ncbi:MAG: hypothetical protein RIQ79_1853 [Verrucomicrobiota bacterium]